MKMHPNVKKCLEGMSDRDFNALKSIYDFRCLSEDQIFELNYRKSEQFKKEVRKVYFQKTKFKKFLDLGLIEEEWSYDRTLPSVYFLTTLGVSVVRRAFKFPNNIYDGKNVSVRGYQTARELKVEDKFIPHQYNLNRFALALSQKMKEKGFEYEYEDERHTSRYNQIRPDGVFYTDVCDIFLEMDMGTETEFQLCEKWNHYRSFKASNEFFNKKKPIKIYFICDNVKNIDKRIKLIKKSISTHFIDIVASDFDIYVGTHESLMKTFNETILKALENNTVDNIDFGIYLKNNFGISIGKSDAYNKVLENNYMFYGKIDDKIFAIDDFTGEPLSVMNKIFSFNIMSSTFEVATQSTCKYIIKVDSVYQISEDFELFNVLITGNILFTTDKLLREAKSFPEAFISFIGPHMTSGKFVDMEFKTYKKVELTKED